MNARKFSVLAALCVLGSVVGESARAADPVVSPAVAAGVEGNGNNGFPFNIGDFGLDSMRLQQIYSAADFAAVSGPVVISEIRFRQDVDSGTQFDSVLPDIEIRLSTTLVAVDQLSGVFSENVGADETIVHSGPLFLSSIDTVAIPREFDIVIPLAVPFYYDPAAGNLLLDVLNYGSGSTTQFDSHSESGDGSSRGFTSFGGDVYSEFADVVTTSALVTKFVFASDEEEEEEPTGPVSVQIDVVPGSAENRVNLKSSVGKPNNGKGKGKPATAGPRLSVAILTTDDYDAGNTDLNTLLLGDPELSGAVPPLKSAFEDIDLDGDLDLVLQFSVDEMVNLFALDAASFSLELTGVTLDGAAISGADALTVVTTVTGASTNKSGNLKKKPLKKKSKPTKGKKK